MDLQSTAELLKISLNNCQIGYKKRKSSNPLNSPSIQTSVKKSKFEGETGGKFECELCGFQGKDKYSLARHQKTHSKLLQKHPCHICQFSFRSVGAVERHVAFYHRNADKTEDYTQNTDVEIKVEEKNTLEENEDPLGDGEEEEEKKNVDEFRCDYCEKSIKNKKHLSRHLATHSGVSHNCPQCQSTFSRRDKLNAHIRKKHQNEENKSQDNCVATASSSNNEDQEVDFEELLDE